MVINHLLTGMILQVGDGQIINPINYVGVFDQFAPIVSSSLRGVTTDKKTWSNPT